MRIKSSKKISDIVQTISMDIDAVEFLKHNKIVGLHIVLQMEYSRNFRWVQLKQNF